MTRILLRAGKDPFAVVPPEEAVRHGRSFFATNTGNLLFADSVHRLLSTSGTEIAVNGFDSDRRLLDDAEVDRVNDEFDHVVLPMANAFRDDFADSMENLTGFIERLRVPVTVVGVGVQTGLRREDWMPTERVADLHRRFVRAVLERSPAIGVRGEVSASYLRRLGCSADQVDVVGCPSLFLRGTDVRVERGAPLRPEDPVALNVTPSVQAFAPFVGGAVASHPRLTYVPQRDWELLFLRDGLDPGRDDDPRLPTHRGHRLYREDRMRMFLDSRSWVDFLSRQRFSVGTRLHGTVASILAGTPAVLVGFDSRTREVAEHHRIPFVALPDLPGDATVESLFELADYTAYDAAAPGIFARLTGFLESHGLAHTAQPGQEATLAAYDERLASLPLSVGVGRTPEPGLARRVLRRVRSSVRSSSSRG